ncbi:MAG: hypothetical protein ACFE8P_05980, partial [Promethearchaeota archaeon]
MTLSGQSKILFDLSHGEMLNIDDEDYSEFSSLLKGLGYRIAKNEKGELRKKIIENHDVLIIGNPISSYFSEVEIKNIVDFVREGGSLLLLSEYGADYLQKTNLNDLAGSYFGIFFEKNLIKENNLINRNCTSILSIKEFNDLKITDKLREVVIGGTCSFVINNLAKPLLIKQGNDHWSEIYNSATQQWIKENSTPNEKGTIIATYRIYGRGKIIALGDIDLFTNDPNIGINKMDNRTFITNM